MSQRAEVSVTLAMHKYMYVFLCGERSMIETSYDIYIYFLLGVMTFYLIDYVYMYIYSIFLIIVCRY